MKTPQHINAMSLVPGDVLISEPWRNEDGELVHDDDGMTVTAVSRQLFSKSFVADVTGKAWISSIVYPDILATEWVLREEELCRICGKEATAEPDLCFKCEERLELLAVERLYDR